MSEKTTIVIVEDNPDLRRVMSDYLKSQDDLDVVGCASDASQALEMVRTMNPDVVLLDLIMPNADGFTFLGWTQTPLSADTTEKPDYYTDSFTPNDSTTLYALYSYVDESVSSGTGDFPASAGGIGNPDLIV